MNLTEALNCTRILDKSDHSLGMDIRYKHMCVWNDLVPRKETIQETLADQFDAHTDYLVTFSEGKVIAATRLILPGPQGFFMEQFVNPYPWLAAPLRTIEFSEVICDPAFRKNSSIIYAQILKMLEYVKQRRYQTAISISTQPWHAVLQRLMFVSTGQSFMSGWQVEMTMFVCAIDRVSKDVALAALPRRFRAEAAQWLE